RHLNIVGAEIARPSDEHLVAHIGVDRAGMYRVDADAVALAGKFEGGGFGEQLDAALCHRIERVLGRADEPGSRGEVDDDAALGAPLLPLAPTPRLPLFSQQI